MTATTTTDVTRLADGFIRLVETNTVPPDVFAPTVLWDLNVPRWRFQLLGPDALVRLHADDYREPPTVEWRRVTPTSTGFVVEYAQRGTDRDGQSAYARIAILFEVRDGRIAEARVYCTGDWDAETETRQKRQAPMIRP